MPPVQRSPRQNPTTKASPEPVSPVGFLPVDPMETGSSPSLPPALTTPPAKPETTAAAGVKPSVPDSPGPERATQATKTTNSSPASVFDAPALRRLFREAVGTVGSVANERLTRTEEARDAGVWLADEDDERDIGDPLGNIAIRRLGLARWKNIEDLEDVVHLIAAGGAYLMANINKLVDLGRARRRRMLAAHAQVPQENGEAA